MKYIPIRKTIEDMQRLLNDSALTGDSKVSPSEVITILRSEPMYDLNWVIQNVTNALVSTNKQFNCVDGDGSDLVIVTREKLDQIIKIIEYGGIRNEDE